MNKKRCFWAQNVSKLYKDYHDKEWGKPVHNERLLFEMLILEGMQAGLSWETILNKRQNYKKAFDNFNPKKISVYNKRKVDKLLKNEGIIRNKLKINAAINNAKAYLNLKKTYKSLDNFLWSYVNFTPIQNKRKNFKQIPAKTALSEKISKDLKKLGFSFVGPTIIYALMQSIGMVNDHTKDCFLYNQ